MLIDDSSNAKALTNIGELVKKRVLVWEYSEKILEGYFEGTVIDLETDSRRLPITFGYLSNKELGIIYIQDNSETAWENFRNLVIDKCNELPRPWLGYYADFDETCLRTLLDENYFFDGDIQDLRRAKDDVAKQLGVPKIFDPLEGRSNMVPVYWLSYLESGEPRFLRSILLHNRACLLKETYIVKETGWWPLSDFVRASDRRCFYNLDDEKLGKLVNCSFKNTVAEIEYQDSRGNITNRKVAVLGAGARKVRCFCFLRGEKRTFRVDRIKSIKIIDEKLNVKY